MKACRGGGDKSPFILNLPTRWGGQPHALATLHPRKNFGAHWVGVSEPVWTLGKEKKKSGAAKIRTLDGSDCTLVTISTKPYKV